MKGLIYKNNQIAVADFEDSYEFIKTGVGGYIEHIPLSPLDEKNIDLWCNEDGKFNSDLKPNLALIYDGKIYDYIVGPVVFAKHDDEGNTIGLDDSDIEFLKTELTAHGFSIINDKLVRCLKF